MNVDIELVKVLLSIDNLLKDETSKIVNYVKTNIHYDGDLFNSNSPFAVNDKTNFSVSSQPGIYVFKFKPNANVQVGKFDETKNAPKLNKSNHTKLGINLKHPFTSNQVLYLGKSEENLLDRLNEHVNNPKSDSTYALKLSDENRKHLLNNCLEVYTFELRDEYKDYAKIILPFIESELHEKLLPRVGSKR